MSATYLDADSQLLKQINSKNGFTLTAREIEFVSPVPAEQVNTEMAKTFNTAITAKMIDTAQFSGSATIYYNRLNLSREFASARFVDRSFMFINRPASLHTILDHVNRKTGLRLTVDNVYDFPLDPLQDFSIVTIRAKPDSKDYIGYFDMGIVNLGATQAVATPDVDVWAEPDAVRKAVTGYGAPTEYQTIHRVYGVDYSPVAGILSRVLVPKTMPSENWNIGDGNVISQWLADALISVDRQAWLYGSGGKLSTYRALPLYNGPTADCKIDTAGYRDSFGEHVGSAANLFADTFNPCNLEFTHALVLYMYWPYYNNGVYRCGLVIHYNVKE